MMVALCSTGLIFATHWKNPPKVDPYYGCTGPNDYFHVTNASNPDQTPHGECLKFNVPVNKTHLCYSLAKGAASSTTPYVAVGICPYVPTCVLSCCAGAARWKRVVFLPLRCPSGLSGGRRTHPGRLDID